MTTTNFYFLQCLYTVGRAAGTALSLLQAPKVRWQANNNPFLFSFRFIGYFPGEPGLACVY